MWQNNNASFPTRGYNPASQPQSFGQIDSTGFEFPLVGQALESIIVIVIIIFCHFHESSAIIVLMGMTYLSGWKKSRQGTQLRKALPGSFPMQHACISSTKEVSHEEGAPGAAPD